MPAALASPVPPGTAPAERGPTRRAPPASAQAAAPYALTPDAAVEIALKMALQYWRNRGEPQRRGLLAFRVGRLPRRLRLFLNGGDGNIYALNKLQI